MRECLQGGESEGRKEEREREEEEEEEEREEEETSVAQAESRESLGNPNENAMRRVSSESGREVTALQFEDG